MIAPRIFEIPFCARLEQPPPSPTCSGKQNMLPQECTGRGRLRGEAPVAANVSGLGLEQMTQRDMNKLDAKPDLLPGIDLPP